MNRNAVTAIRELHARIPHPYLEGQYRCEHCASLCHDSSGVGCEVGGDAPWPCDTIRLLDEAMTIPGEVWVDNMPKVSAGLWVEPSALPLGSCPACFCLDSSHGPDGCGADTCPCTTDLTKITGTEDTTP